MGNRELLSLAQRSKISLSLLSLKPRPLSRFTTLIKFNKIKLIKSINKKIISLPSFLDLQNLLSTPYEFFANGVVC